jgi:hypothetical protein
MGYENKKYYERKKNWKMRFTEKRRDEKIKWTNIYINTDSDNFPFSSLSISLFKFRRGLKF